MTGSAHLWAIGYPDAGRAEQVRANIGALSEGHCLVLLETAVAVRFPDGSVTLDGIPFVPVRRLRSHPLASFLAGLALAAPPLSHAAVGTLLSAVGTAPSAVGISEEFVREVEGLIAPGTSVLFVLDRECDMAAILQGIRALGGTVLKTNVDLERARLIQATLLATSTTEQQEPDRRQDDSARS
jgi:uncharacterized membrane protein